MVEETVTEAPQKLRYQKAVVQAEELALNAAPWVHEALTPHDREAAEAFQLEQRKDFIMAELQQLITRLRNAGEDTRELDDALAAIASAQTPEQIKRAIADAKSALATKAAASPEAEDLLLKLMTKEEIKVLWEKMEKLDKEIEDILRPHMSEEEREKNDQFLSKLKAAATLEERLKLEKEYTEWRMQLTKEWLENGSPEQQEAAAQANPLLAEQQKIRDTLIGKTDSQHLKKSEGMASDLESKELGHEDDCLNLDSQLGNFSAPTTPTKANMVDKSQTNTVGF